MKRRYDDSPPSYRKPLYGDSLYSAFAWAKNNPGIDSFEHLLDRLPQFKSMDTCSEVFCLIAIYVKDNDSLSRDIKSILSTMAIDTFEQFDELLSLAPRDLEQCYSSMSGYFNENSEKNIGFLLYNCGKIVDEGIRAVPLFADNLELLINLIQYGDINNSISISHSLYGLGLLANNGMIRGKIDINVITPLFTRLLSLADLDSQSLANCLYCVGALAKAGNLKGFLELNNVMPLFEKMSFLDDFSNYSVANCFNGLARLAKAEKLQGKLDVQSIIFMVTTLKKDISTHTIASIFYGYGLLARAGNLQGILDEQYIVPLLDKLLSLDDFVAPDIANSIYGMGLLAIEEKLQANLDIKYISLIIDKLLDGDALNNQNVSNFLYGMGFLAKAEKLQGILPVKSITSLIDKLLSSDDIDCQHINNALNGLGLLAHYGNLRGILDIKTINSLLNKLLQASYLKAQDIGISIQSAGLLAEVKILQGFLDARLLSSLLKALSTCDNVNAQYISYSLYGSGLLADAGNLKGTFDTQLIILFEKLLSYESLKAKYLSKSLDGIGRLAKAGKMKGIVDNQLINTVFKKLLILPTVGKTLSQSFTGLCSLGQTDNLPTMLEKQLIISLLEKLLINDNLSNCFAYSLYGLGLLAKADKLAEPLESKIIMTLLTKLSSSSKAATARHISLSIYGIGLLAQKGKLLGKFESETLFPLLEKLQAMQGLSEQQIAITIFGLGKLYKEKRSSAPISVDQLIKFIDQLLQLNPGPKAVYLVLNGVSDALMPSIQIPSLQSNKLSSQLKQLLATTNKSYLHPSQVAYLINCLVIFRNYFTNSFDEEFLRLVTALAIKLEHFPSRIQLQLNANIAALDAHPLWKNALGSRLGIMPLQEDSPEMDGLTPIIPASTIHQAKKVQSLPTAHLIKAKATGSTTKTTRNSSNQSDAIFQSILRKNEERLKSILSMQNKTLAAPKARRHNKASQHRAFTGSYALPLDCEPLVVNFFSHTDAKILKELIRNSEYHYFVWLLQACTLRTRNQLAKSNRLHLLLIYLPIKELKELINRLISPFQCYRDHQALVHLCDALTIRSIKEPDSGQQLVELQQRIINRGLEYHEKCNHSRVVSLLKDTLADIKASKRVLLIDVAEEDDDEREEVESQFAPSQAPVVNTDATTSLSLAVLAQSTSIVPSSVPRPTTPQTALVPVVIDLSQQEKTVVKQNALTVNSNYEYETEDIQAILAERFRKYPYVYVMAAAQLMEHRVQNNGCAKIVQDFLNNLKRRFLDTQQSSLLIPIHTPGHWVGIVVDLKGNTIQNIRYFNSLQNSKVDDQLMAKIKADFVSNNLINNQVTIRAATTVLQQCDSKSCGPMLIDNFYWTLNKKWPQYDNSKIVSAEVISQIRQRHLEILQQARPDYYPKFLRRQSTNQSSVPSIAKQIQQHGLLSHQTNTSEKRPVTHFGETPNHN